MPESGIYPDAHSLPGHLEYPARTFHLTPTIRGPERTPLRPPWQPPGLSLFPLSQAAVVSIPSSPAGLHSSQIVAMNDRVWTWAQNPGLPRCSSELEQSLWTQVSPRASGIGSAQSVSRLNYVKYESLLKGQLHKKEIILFSASII